MDHDLGTSTFSCLKITLPASSVISAVRFSHSIWSNGLTLASLKTRWTGRVLCAARALLEERTGVAGTCAARRRAPRDAGVDRTASLVSIIGLPFEPDLLIF